MAFSRTNTPPELDTPANPQPFGITDAAGNITAGGVGRLKNNALWFAEANAGNTVAYNDTNLPYAVNNATNTPTPGTIDGSRIPLPTLAASSTNPPPPAPYTGSQPLLMPVPQITNSGGAQGGQQTGWITHAADNNGNGTTFNLIVGAGDTPPRTLDNTSGEFNGGLQNLPRFLERWSNTPTTGTIPNNIKGSFIQQNRSAFSTAPYFATLRTTSFPANAADRLASIFSTSPNPATAPTLIPGTNDSVPDPVQEITGYNIRGYQFPYFTPPARNWGFDVGLLSQPPDLFTQRFTTPSTRTQPAEYFREVPRNDPWVQALMCSRVAPDQVNNNSANQPATSLRTGCPT
ncbi:MAG: hypothetical protein HC894_07330 [Microcoleus sp. SM1_3_4]|nr:hypothetical protein [Microcoleus sp. SM1_3_4]